MSTRLLTNCDVNTECTVTLPQAVKATTSGGQGFFRCDCGNGKKQCQTNRCKCFKAGKMCNLADVITVSHVRTSSNDRSPESQQVQSLDKVFFFHIWV